jgi:protein O-GlcNAc transferase
MATALKDVLDPFNRAPTLGERAVADALSKHLAGQTPEAIRLLEQATKRAPSDPQLAFNFGIVAMEAGQWELAIDRYSAAARLKPTWFPAWSNLAHCYAQLGRWDDVIAAATRSLELNPKNALAYINRCGAYLGLGREEEAIEDGRRAIKLDPKNSRAHLNLGVAYRAVWDLERAERHYREVTVLDPKYASGWADLAQAYSLQGRLREAVAAAEVSTLLEPQNPIMRANLILYLDTAPGVALRDAWAERRVYNALFARPYSRQGSFHPNDRDPDRALRVGYVSSDFRTHSAAFAVLPLVEHRDPARQYVTLYSGSGFRDDLTDRFEAAADDFVVTQQMNDDALARRVHADRIDVLVDLSAFSSGGRLLMFARRPAPVQVTAWGYATGTGLDCFDAFFADDVTVPESAEPFYSEAVMRLPAIIPYDWPTAPPEPGPLPMLANGYVTFGSFNRLEKLTPDILDVWARVLDELPTSRLVVKFSGLQGGRLQAQVRGLFEQRGVDPERLTLLGHTDRVAHIEAIRGVDMLLDAAPHGGGITTLEALSVGVPCVTLLGDRVPGRLSASFLGKVGLPELVAETPDEYVAKAVAAVSDPARLAAIRADLPARLEDSPMRRHKEYVGAVEATFRTLWHGWLKASERRVA